MSAIDVSDSSFDAEVLSAEGAVVVDFWAEWCGPCQQVAPVLEDVGKAFDGQLKVAKVNVDENPRTPAKYGVRGIPTLILFKDGEVQAAKVGALSREQMEVWIRENS